MRKIEWIVIHCSDSDYGDDNIIGAWHAARGWGQEYDSVMINCGYHFVVLNGHVTHQAENDVFFLDGTIEVGRRLAQEGAHVLHGNANSIGICIIGRSNFTEKQLASARKLCASLLQMFGLGVERVIGHREGGLINDSVAAELRINPRTCPNMDMVEFRASILREIAGDKPKPWWVRVMDAVAAIFTKG